MYTFREFLGNASIVKGLENMISSDRVGHAYIFDGARGMGKKTLAITFAKALQCENGKGIPCGSCRACKSIDSGDNADVFFISSKKKTIGVDVMRDEVIERANTKPFCSKYKIFIITEGEKLTEQAQNSILKTIEEPPSYGIFILLTTNYRMFLETIISRCSLIRLGGLGADIIEKELVKRKLCDRAEAAVISECSGGSLGQAIKLADDEIFFSLRERAVGLPERIEESDLMGLYDILEDIMSCDKRLKDFLDLLYLFYRDLIVYKKCGGDFVVQKDYMGVIEHICGIISLKRLLRAERAVREAESDIEINVNKQLCIEQMLFDIKQAD